MVIKHVLACFPRGKDDFYSNLAAMAENNVESDISDADVGTMAKSIAVSLYIYPRFSVSIFKFQADK